MPEGYRALQQPAISGVYYVDDGHAAGSGARTPLEFEDPRACSGLGPLARWFQQAAVQIAPSDSGTFVLFPSWLRHRVREHSGPRPRISISFNLVIPNIVDVGTTLDEDQARKELLDGGAMAGMFDDVGDGHHWKAEL